MSIMPKQFRGLTSTDPKYSKWNVLAEDGIVAVSLGIQAPSNTAFKINTENDNDIIYIGATGIYELNLQQGLGTITSLTILNAKEIGQEDIVAEEDEENTILIDILYEASNSDLDRTDQIQEVKQV